MTVIRSSLNMLSKKLVLVNSPRAFSSSTHKKHIFSFVGHHNQQHQPSQQMVSNLKEKCANVCVVQEVKAGVEHAVKLKESCSSSLKDHRTRRKAKELQERFKSIYVVSKHFDPTGGVVP